jgi:AraC-like DNA-binding protein
MLIALKSIASFNFLLFAFFILYYRKRLDVAIGIFAFFLLGKGITLTSSLILEEVVLSDQPLLYITGILANSFLFFYAPFLFLFSKSISKGMVSIKEEWIHFIPFGIFLFFNIYISFQLPFGKNEGPFSSIVWLRNTYHQLYYLQVVFYTIWAYIIISKSQSNTLRFQKISTWLKRILALFLLIWILYLVGNLSYTYFEATKFVSILDFVALVLLIYLANFTLIIALNNPEYFYINLSLKSQKESDHSIVNLKNYERLCGLVKDEKFYQNPNLKIGDLSSRLGISTRNTSSLISTFHEGNFYDFINTFRIEEAKRMLKEDDRLTMLSILYDAGFNSKSVFNSAFKKIVGETPSSYRKKNMAT